MSWVVSSVTYPGAALVAQVSNLADFQSADHSWVVTIADWKSATQQVGNLRYVSVFMAMHL